MPGFILDCNHLSEALRKVSRVRDRIRRHKRLGHRFVTCFPVLCELEVAIQHSTLLDDNRRYLQLLLRDVRIWPMTQQTANDYATIYLELRARGRCISQVDNMVAAMARRHKLTILTTDRDFEALPDLNVEDWTIA